MHLNDQILCPDLVIPAVPISNLAHKPKSTVTKIEDLTHIKKAMSLTLIKNRMHLEYLKLFLNAYHENSVLDSGNKDIVIDVDEDMLSL